MNETLRTILIILVSFLTPCILFVAMVFAWFKGAAFTYNQFQPPEQLPPTPTTKQLEESISKIPCPYDIVFDTYLTTHFATGNYAFSWDKIYGDIVNHATSFAKDLDPNIKTIVVRSVKINKSGKPEFTFEPIVNSLKT